MTDTVQRIWALLRIMLGLVFFWAFIDKLFGLGFGTAPDNSWLSGASVTSGFLGSSHGPFAFIFEPLVGLTIIDWLFMLGLLGVGVSLLLGAGIRLGSYGGIALLVLMWLSHLPPSHHPFVDEHIVYALVLLALPLVDAGKTWGIGKWWSGIVKGNAWLE